MYKKASVQVVVDGLTLRDDEQATQAIQLTQEQFQQLLGQLNVGNNAGSTADATTTSSKSVKPTRPSIDIDTSEGEWALFDDEWARFKQMAKLVVDDEIRDNLRQCCTPQLNKRLFDVKGAATLNVASEQDLLSWIKEIAVKGVHKEVHRTQFVHCKQKQGEGLNSYYGRLKAESSLCDFRVPAPKHVEMLGVRVLTTVHRYLTRMTWWQRN